MNFFATLRAAAVSQCQGFFYGLILNALKTEPEEMVDWVLIDPAEFEIDEAEEHPPILMKRVALPLFAIVNADEQEQYATNAADEIETAFGVNIGLFQDISAGEIIVYISNYPVDVNRTRELFNDEEDEDEGLPSREEIGASLAVLEDDDIAFLNFIRTTVGEQIFDDITFDEDDETVLREFLMSTDSAEELEISNDCLLALRNEYDDEEEELEEEEEEEEEAAAQTPLSIVPQIPAPVQGDDFEPLDDFEAEAPVIEGEKTEPVSAVDLAGDDFEAEQRTEAEQVEAEAEQDAAIGAPDNAHEESFIDDQGQAVPNAVETAPAPVQAAPAESVEETSEHQMARFNRILEDFAAKLPTDTISELKDGVVTVMLSRSVEGVNKDYVLNVKIEHENFAGIKMMDVFYVFDDQGQQVLRATNVAAVLDMIAAL